METWEKKSVLFLSGETNGILISLMSCEDNVQLTNQKELKTFGKWLIRFFALTFLQQKLIVMRNSGNFNEKLGNFWRLSQNIYNNIYPYVWLCAL